MHKASGKNSVRQNPRLRDSFIPAQLAKSCFC